ESELKSLVEYNNSLESLYSELRQFRHDYLNILSTLSGYIEEKDLDGLENYFNNNIIKYTERISNNNHRITCLRNLKVNSIKGLVFSKIIKAQELGIDVELEVVSEINKVSMEEIDLARCLGIIIDNAIEGTLESEKRNLKLAFISANEAIIIIVVNSIKDNIPPLFKLVEKGYSTKGDNRGLGLYNLKEIVSEYPNVNMDINITQNEFIVAIECKN
ncbi:MAG: sensor histidine kinase, partial [Clostridium sp.]